MSIPGEQRPQVRFQGTNVKTKAYAIETTKTDSMEMMKLLQQAYQENNAFTFFQMRQKNPEAYARVIIKQTQIMAGHHVIILHNVDVDAMFFLSAHIQSVPGVLDIGPALTVLSDGRHKVLVGKDDFHSARKSLIEHLSEWYEEHVSEDAKQINDKFLGAPEVAPLFSDGCSSGEGTYMSSSIYTAMSYTSTLSDHSFAGYDATHIIDMTEKENKC